MIVEMVLSKFVGRAEYEYWFMLDTATNLIVREHWRRGQLHQKYDPMPRKEARDRWRRLLNYQGYVWVNKQELKEAGLLPVIKGDHNG